MTPVILSAVPSDTPLIEALLADRALGIRRIDPDRILGGSDLETVIVLLNPEILAATVKVLRETWARNGELRIEARGIRAQGSSPDDVEAAFQQILERAQSRGC